MHGREGENWKHMWSVPSRGTTKTRTVARDSTADSFCKDGRKISVGDCALFKPPQDSPPFIGIIRWLTLNKENNLQLGVNWLYRPTEVKLGKGIVLDAAPNEVFYSFHKDEIPAASLLHPCKVAFLPKGAELPSGLSSFVCRRVYDIANKCLWWLTDQNYINEHQEEVDQLLYKTRIEMHATVQPGGRSPKQINGPTSTSQLKSGSDNVTGVSAFASQVKGKKRERVDQASEPVKRERSLRTDDGDSTQLKLDSCLKSEIAKITERGGLVDSEVVEKLVQLMQTDRAERKMDLISRSMLAAVLAATDKFDCLSRFVHLKGLVILDEWLQDIHKGKIGDGSSPSEEFLLVLLRALDKLPVNLHALQMSNIGKSVNYLRTHKNFEIQKKARTLVDTWKKRVEAEMNIIDSKSGSTQTVSWSSRSRLPEVSQAGNRHPGGSSDVPVKSSVAQLSAPKPVSVKPVQGESNVKSSSSSPGSMKSSLSPASGKDGQTRYVAGSTCDLPSTTVREEKSSSSSPSHNNSQSFSSDHAKSMVFSGKEDARSSTAGSMSVNKLSSSGSRHRRSSNGLPGAGGSGVQRETGSSRSSALHRNSVSEKLSHSGFTCEKSLDAPTGEGNSHKLIVKIPNRGRSPAQSVSGGSHEDPSIMNSRVSSPAVSEKHDQFERSSKEKNDAYKAHVTSDVNTESWQSNDLKDVLTGSDEGDGSPGAVADEERSGTGDDARKLAGISKAASSSSEKLHEASLTSINVLIDSCVKYSEANTSSRVGDDVGMNLLASVAAGEMSKSDLDSPTASPQRNTTVGEETCDRYDVKLKALCMDDIDHDQSKFIDNVIENQTLIAETSCSRDGLHGLPKNAMTSFYGDRKSTVSQEVAAGECNDHLKFSNTDVQQNANSCLETNKNLDEGNGAFSVSKAPSDSREKLMDVQVTKQPHEEGGIVNAKTNESNSQLIDVKAGVALSILEAGTAAADSLPETGRQDHKSQALDNEVLSEQKQHVKIMLSERVERSREEILQPSRSGCDLTSETIHDSNVGKAEEMDSRNCIYEIEKHINDNNSRCDQTPENQGKSSLGTAIISQSKDCVETNVECKEDLEHQPIKKMGLENQGGAFSQNESPALSVQELEQHMRSKGSKSSNAEADDTVKCNITKADDASCPAAGASHMEEKPKFDLNEGFIVDDGKCGEAASMTRPVSSTAIQSMNSLPFPVSPVSTGFPASITVAAAAKGPFVPPEDLLRSKGELGWKGTAATSAFRPAEPRRVLEMPLGTTTTPSPDATSSKRSRPPLDIDLNVADERGLEDMTTHNSGQEIGCSSSHINSKDLSQSDLITSAPSRVTGGLDLDLNRTDEANDIGLQATSCSRQLEAPLLPLKSSLLGGFSNPNLRRDFDLNNGPAVDDVSAEPLLFNQHGRSIMQSQPTVSGLRMNNAEIGNFSSWFQPGNYSAVTVPSVLPDRGEQHFPIVATGGPQRIVGPPISGTPFAPDVYRGSVLSSSPAVPFPSSPFQYPVFPFGNSFPLPSATFSGGTATYMDSSSGGRLCFSAVNSQLLGPAGSVSSYPRPYVVSLQDGGNNVTIENSRKWARQGLDLNAGPGGLDSEGRDDTFPSASRQLSVASSQALAEEQARMYHVAGGASKRKEPEGGWDAESFRYKQSWQ